MFVKNAPASAVRLFWGEQLSRLGRLVTEAEPAQAKWDSFIPGRLRSATGKLKTIA